MLLSCPIFRKSVFFKTLAGIDDCDISVANHLKCRSQILSKYEEFNKKIGNNT